MLGVSVPTADVADTPVSAAVAPWLGVRVPTADVVACPVSAVVIVGVNVPTADVVDCPVSAAVLPPPPASKRPTATMPASGHPSELPLGPLLSMNVASVAFCVSPAVSVPHAADCVPVLLVTL